MNPMDDLFAPPPDLIAGVDEAGRGPLAGPVAVAAVILHAQKEELTRRRSGAEEKRL